MVARILRLRLAVLVAGLRFGAGRAARTVAKVAVLTAVVAIGCWALLQLRDADESVLGVVTVAGGSAVTLGFIVAPVMTGAVDALDPRAFRPFGFRSGALAAALAAAGMLSVPVAAAAAVAVCAAVLWIQRGVSPVVAVAAAVLAVATWTLSARVFSATAGFARAPRRPRRRTGAIAVALVIAAVPAAVYVAAVQADRVPPALSDAADVLARTPLGAAWALPWRTDAAVLIVSTATVIVLAGVWWAVVARIQRTVDRAPAERDNGRLGWFDVTWRTAMGAVAARSLLYWLTDARYLANYLVVPIMAVVAMVPPLVVGVPFTWVILVPVPLMALFLGWLPHNDLAYDSTAVWLHVSTGVRGISDRFGRLVPVLLIGIVVLVVTIPVAVGLHGDWSVTPLMAGVCASAFFSGLGLSSITSVAVPSPVPLPGDSFFRQPQRVSASGAMAAGGVLLGAIMLTAPALWWSHRVLVGEGRAWVALWGGVGVGLAVLIVGLAIGAFVFERRGARLLEAAEAV